MPEQKFQTQHHILSTQQSIENTGNEQVFTIRDLNHIQGFLTAYFSCKADFMLFKSLTETLGPNSKNQESKNDVRTRNFHVRILTSGSMVCGFPVCYQL